ncbi:MAG: TonB-dependent receptor [Hyphomonadaceae bacterium]
MRTKLGAGILFASASLGALMSVASAWAQEAQQGAVGEEIVVTAQRRDQNMQDVPVTVTTFGAQEIRDARIQAVPDVAARTPGLNFDAFPSGQPRLFVRGVGSSDRGAAGDPSAGVFLDEVYLARPTMIAFDAFDVARIEVVKGPQGTLYGRNVVGGAINVISAMPDPGAFDASLEGSLGNYERADAAGFVNVPLGDAAAIRASGAIRTHGGYADNLTTGGELSDQDTRSGRVQFLLEPTEQLRFSIGADVTTDRANGPAQYVVALDDTDPLSGFWNVNTDRDSAASEYDGRQDRDTWGVRAQAIWDLPHFTLNYLVGHREVNYEVDYDFDGGPRDEASRISIGGGNLEDSSSTSHELRLLSPGGSGIDWVVGLYAFNADTRRDDRLDLAIPDFDGVFDFSDGGTEGLLLTEIYHQRAEVESRAIYADATIPLTERLNLTAGIRYTEDEKTYHVDNLDSDATFRAEEDIDATNTASWEAVTWRVGVDYHFSDEHMAYVMISRGFKSGGFQETPENQLDALTPFDPEFATQYEIGTRSSFLDGRLIWNNTFYVMNYEDLQVRETSGLNIFTANADATIYGYETLLRWDIGAGFRLDASYAYTDATFDSYVLPSTDYSGNNLTRVPENKVVLSPSYTHTFGSGAELEFAVDYQYESFIWDDASNVGNEFRDPTHFVDARAVFTSAEGDWSLSLWGRNLTDEVTRTHQATFIGATFASFNPPPTYGVTLRWNY